MSRRNDAAGSRIVFIEFGNMEVDGGLGQAALAGCWWPEPDLSEAALRNKETKTANGDDSLQIGYEWKERLEENT